MYKFTLNLILLLLLLPFAETSHAQDPTPPIVACPDCRDGNLYPEDIRNFVHNLIENGEFATYSDMDVFIVVNGVGQHTLVDVDALTGPGLTLSLGVVSGELPSLTSWYHISMILPNGNYKVFPMHHQAPILPVPFDQATPPPTASTWQTRLAEAGRVYIISRRGGDDGGPDNEDGQNEAGEGFDWNDIEIDNDGNCGACELFEWVEEEDDWADQPTDWTHYDERDYEVDVFDYDEESGEWEEFVPEPEEEEEEEEQ